MRDDSASPRPPNANDESPGGYAGGSREHSGRSASSRSSSGVSRRSFIKTIGASAAASSLAAAAHASGLVGRDGDVPGKDNAAPTIIGPDPTNITLNINGKGVQLKAEPATTLLEALRFHLNLTGSKEICDRGACGGCSVIVDGLLINACMTLAMDCVGSRITTIEGLADGDRLDPVQTAFIKHDGLQCGYCTPGLVMACRSLLNNNAKPTLEQIKCGLSGNICRCGTYTNIFNAALEASGQSPIVDQK